MNIKKLFTAGSMFLVFAVAFLCVGVRSASARTSPEQSSLPLTLTCAQAEAAVDVLQGLEQEVTDLYEQGYLSSTEEQNIIAAIEEKIQEIEAAAPSGCNFSS